MSDLLHVLAAFAVLVAAVIAVVVLSLAWALLLGALLTVGRHGRDWWQARRAAIAADDAAIDAALARHPAGQPLDDDEWLTVLMDAVREHRAPIRLDDDDAALADIRARGERGERA